MTKTARQPAQPATPKGLGEAGSSLWLDLTKVWNFGPDESALLLEACRTADELESLKATLDALEDPKDKARYYHEVRQHRLALKNLLKFLRLNEETDPAERARLRSEHGRRLARARWSKA